MESFPRRFQQIPILPTTPLFCLVFGALPRKMDTESFPRPPLRAILPALKRRPHVTRRTTQGEGRSRAAASWSSMPASRARPVSDEMVSGRPRPMCYRDDDMSRPLPPVPSATFEIVSAMPECLQVRAREPSLDLSAWVENTNRYTLQGGIVDEELVPWMQLPQPEFSGIDKSHYRDTPLYSEAGSPDLSRAYPTDEVACPQPRPPIVSWASWATFGVCENYTGSESSISPKRGASSNCQAGDDISYYGGASGEDRASVSSQQNSTLSIKCQGHNILELPPLALGQPAAQPVEESVLPDSHACDFMDWAENGSSGGSSPCYSECAYEVSNLFSVIGLVITCARNSRLRWHQREHVLFTYRETTPRFQAGLHLYSNETPPNLRRPGFPLKK